MALTKVTKSGLSDDSVDASKIEDGTIVNDDIAPGTITNAKLAGSIANDKLANSSITLNGQSLSLGGSQSVLFIQWQAVVTADGSTNTSATSGYGYFIDTSSNAHTITLPASPSAGDYVAIKDYAESFGTNNLTIARNGSNIQGAANNSVISTNRASVVLVYVDSTKGWLYTNESNVADLQVKEYVAATGGTVTTHSDDKVHVFLSDGCFVVSNAGNSAGSNSVEYLVLAGGGGARHDRSGGGGAGGFRTNHSPSTPSPRDGGLSVSAQTYPITVGAGGTAGSGPTVAGKGNNSVFSTITSTGGGHGKGQSCGPSNPSNANGGSGGGGAGQGTSAPAGQGNTPPVSPSQGSNGGAGNGTESGPRLRGGGGGGGAGGVGTTATTSQVGNGGSGVSNDIAPPRPGSYAGGGGGGGQNSASCGGTGAGDGPGNSTSGSSAGANTGAGGGGGGCSSPSGGSGGSGMVVIRYKFQN